MLGIKQQRKLEEQIRLKFSLFFVDKKIRLFLLTKTAKRPHKIGFCNFAKTLSCVKEKLLI